MEYKFQFGNDEASCLALATMLSKGWSIKEYSEEDGYGWFYLTK